MKILVTPTSLSGQKSNPALDMLKGFTDEIVYNPYGRPLHPEELIPLLSDVDGMIAGLDYISDKVIYSAPDSFKAISRYGAGHDRVDLKAAADRGIMVSITPGVNSDSVAELAVGLMISVARSIPELDSQVKAGKWPRSTGIQIFGKTLGILGLGGIGKCVAKRAKGLSMEILAFDPYIDKEYAEKNGVVSCSFDNVIAKSDFLSLHLPLNHSTKHIINSQVISNMKNGTIIINTARGGLIDEQAAYDALATGKLGGLGLDVFEEEPPKTSPLFKLHNVVTTPHTGAHTVEAINNMAMLAVENLKNMLSNKTCPYLISWQKAQET